MLYYICYIPVYTGFNTMYIHILQTSQPHIDLSGHLYAAHTMYIYACMYMSDFMY